MDALGEFVNEERRRRGGGWYVGAAVFWLISAWIVTVGLSSIIPAIFWPEAAAEGRVDDTSCGNALLELEGELLDHVGANMLRVRDKTQREELSRWLEAWDRRLVAMRPTCKAEEQTAWTELSRLRHGLRGLVDRFDREQAPRLRHIDALLRGARHPNADGQHGSAPRP